MEPICGQTFGAKNFKLLHKTLLMAVLLLLLISIPISLLWLNVHKILIAFGLKEEISSIAKRYLIYLLPDLPVLSLLCPLKAYLSSQGRMEGVAMAVWITDLIVVILLTGYVIVSEGLKEKKWKEAGRLPNPVESVLALIIVFNFK
ncbi:unnamed protein product [Brassica oleracea var. botrytis]